MSSHIGIRVGQKLALAAAVAVGVTVFVDPARAATVTVTGITLEAPLSGFSFSGNDALSSPVSVTYGGTASISGVTGSGALTVYFDFTLTSALANALAFDVPISGASSYQLLSGTWGGSQSTVTGVSYAGATKYSDLTAGEYTLAVSGTDFEGSLFVTQVSNVPVPAAVLLFGSGLAGLVGVGRLMRRTSKDEAGATA